LKFGRIKLKKPEWNDIKFIQWLWSDPETMKPVGGPIILDDQKAKVWFERMIAPGRHTDSYRLILNQDLISVGEISFHRLIPETMTADFNIKIANKYRSKGYSKEAMVLFLDYFFNEIGGLVLKDEVALENELGQQALLSFGFKHDPSVKKVFMLKITRKHFNNLYQDLHFEGEG